MSNNRDALGRSYYSLAYHGIDDINRMELARDELSVYFVSLTTLKLLDKITEKYKVQRVFTYDRQTEFDTLLKFLVDCPQEYGAGHIFPSSSYTAAAALDIIYRKNYGQNIVADEDGVQHSILCIMYNDINKVLAECNVFGIYGDDIVSELSDIELTAPLDDRGTTLLILATIIDICKTPSQLIKRVCPARLMRPTQYEGFRAWLGEHWDEYQQGRISQAELMMAYNEQTNRSVTACTVSKVLSDLGFATKGSIGRMSLGVGANYIIETVLPQYIIDDGTYNITVAQLAQLTELSPSFVASYCKKHSYVLVRGKVGRPVRIMTKQGDNDYETR